MPSADGCKRKMQLTEHFSLEELVASEVAARSGIDNTPPPWIMSNLKTLADGLEWVRAVLGGRLIHVNSGYRCAALNAAIGGASNSMHMQGLAADILCPEVGPPLVVCRAIVAGGIETDQVIYEFGLWCHVAFAAPGTRARRELLTIASAAQGYRQGLNAIA
jgi:zinc D-Ala-D-Ala carboxypeptidase